MNIVNKKSNTDRKKYLDMAKGIAILSIIAGHLNLSIITKFVYTFHVPLFIIISGYLFKESKLIFEIFGRLIKPYLFTVILILLFDELKCIIKIILRGGSPYKMIEVAGKWILAGIYGSGSRNDLFGLTLPVIGAIWFLWAIFWAAAMLHILKLLHLNFINEVVLCVITFLLAYFSAKFTWFPFSIQAGMASLLFIYTGYQAKLNEKTINQSKKNILIVSFLFWITAIYLSFTNANMNLVKCFFPNMLINVTGAIGGSFVILYLCKFLEKNKLISDIFAFYGKNTAAVLCFHLVELNTFPWKIISGIITDRWIEFIIIFLCKIIWITFGIVITRRFKYFRLVFY